MIPNSKIDTPPSTGGGIVPTKAISFPEKDSKAANTAAPPITHTLKTRVKTSTPIFSPYVVFGGPPIRDEISVPKPSPSNER